MPINQSVVLGSSCSGYYMLDQLGCSAAPVPLRLSTDNIPQADGMILHRAFKTGYLMTLRAELWETIGSEGQPACGDVLACLWDHLLLHLNAILRDDESLALGGLGRMSWDPSGALGCRMLDHVRLAQWPEVFHEGSLTGCVFAIHTGLPYAMDCNETVTAINATVVNLGTSDFYPVFKVYGPSAAFTLTNVTTGLEIVYSDAFPGAVAIGGGDYVEINTFRNTVYLNGSGANRKAGIDIVNSEFFPLVPGSNQLTIVGATCDMLWQSAWC